MGSQLEVGSGPIVEDLVTSRMVNTFHDKVVVRIWIVMQDYFESVWEHTIITMWYKNVIL